MELKQKGSNAQIGAFKQLMVSLIWTSAVDLDLMAFYKTKTGQTGGVYSDNYAGGSQGDLNNFPFIQLSGDAGVGATGGDNREEIRIANLDQIEELHICALNFTDASRGSDRVFADYDARVQVLTDRDETYNIFLDSRDHGPVAVICSFKAGFMGASLINDSSVMTFNQFQSTIPGASALRLASKITLAQKGDSHVLQAKGVVGEIIINLNWNQQVNTGGSFIKSIFSSSSGIDLDLGCFYEMINGNKSVIDGLQFSNDKSKQGSLNAPPYIYHLGDDRTGGSATGEYIKVNMSKLHELRRMIIYAFIYEGVARWKDTDGIVLIKVSGQPEIKVEMGMQTDKRNFCAIAGLDFLAAGKEIKITKYVTFHYGHMECDKAYNWGLKWTTGSK